MNLQVLQGEDEIKEIGMHLLLVQGVGNMELRARFCKSKIVYKSTGGRLGERIINKMQMTKKLPLSIHLRMRRLVEEAKPDPLVKNIQLDQADHQGVWPKMAEMQIDRSDPTTLV